MVIPIQKKLDCVCGRLRGKGSHRRGKYVVYAVGYKDKQGVEHITKLKLECLTCTKTKIYEVKENGKTNQESSLQ